MRRREPVKADSGEGSGADGAERVIATSQMQATDCRRAFPCFDEPDFKAVFDVTLIVDGWHGDSSRMYPVGEISRKAERLVEVTYECLMRGIAMVKPGAHLGDIREYYLEIGGVRHSLKPAFALVTGVPSAGFTTQDAYRMFAGVGLTVGRL